MIYYDRDRREWVLVYQQPQRILLSTHRYDSSDGYSNTIGSCSRGLPINIRLSIVSYARNVLNLGIAHDAGEVFDDIRDCA